MKFWIFFFELNEIWIFKMQNKNDENLKICKMLYGWEAKQ